MNIFPELTRQLKQRQLERDEAAAKKMHISLQEYYEYKKAEEQQKIEHENYLKRKGITEEQYQRKLQGKGKWSQLFGEDGKYSEILGCSIAILGIVGFFALFYVIGNFIEESEILTTIVYVIGGLWVLDIVIQFVIAPLAFIVWAFLRGLKFNKVVTAILTFLITGAILCGTTYTCNGVPSSDTYIRGRPDRY